MSVGSTVYPQIFILPNLASGVLGLCPENYYSCGFCFLQCWESIPGPCAWPASFLAIRLSPQPSHTPVSECRVPLQGSGVPVCRGPGGESEAAFSIGAPSPVGCPLPSSQLWGGHCRVEHDGLFPAAVPGTTDTTLAA